MLEDLTGAQKVIIALLVSGVVLSGLVIMILVTQNGSSNTPNTVTTESGLQYTVTQTSESTKVAKDGNVVNFMYTGRRASDGYEFDSNIGGTPLRTVLGQGRMIPGIEEALIGMKEGEKRTATIPPDLAYADQDSEEIPANSTLIFDLELVEIE
jgi:FKBP-type peptidyl-prolyl cis-trans isomerase